MFVFLVLVIIAILLFGSGAALGSVGMLLVGMAAFIPLIVAFEIWGSLSGASRVLLYAVPVLSFSILFATLYVMTQCEKRKPRVAPVRKPVDTIWLAYDFDISNKFDPATRAEALRISKSGNATELEHFCEAEVRRDKGQ